MTNGVLLTIVIMIMTRLVFVISIDAEEAMTVDTFVSRASH